MSQTGTATAREKFLAEASAYLDTRCQPLANECRHQAAVLRAKSSKDPDFTQLQCSACGSLDIHENMVVKSRSANECKLQLLKCQWCLRTTKRQVRMKPSEKSKPEIRAKASIASRTASESSEAQTTGKISSKKRAKERRNQGLQAILEKSKEPVQKPTSFGLLDFMSKKG